MPIRYFIFLRLVRGLCDEIVHGRERGAKMDGVGRILRIEEVKPEKGLTILAKCECDHVYPWSKAGI